LIDVYEEFYNSQTDCKILFEGAQGFGLDIDWGDYPYVTSSGCTVAAAINNGVPHNRIRNVWGVAKAYETYVGAKKFEPSDEIFKKIREVGQEFGATTGRPRQCNWLNTKNLFKAININGANILVFNKADILREIGVWKVYDQNNEIVEFKSEQEMRSWISNNLPNGVSSLFWSDSPERI
jgi:adenylosuccinate synthase